MHEPDFLLFASDATLVGIAGGGLLLIALVAMLAERRRLKRQDINAVGCMPWSALFMLTFFGGAILMALAVKGWLSG